MRRWLEGLWAEPRPEAPSPPRVSDVAWAALAVALWAIEVSLRAEIPWTAPRTWGLAALFLLLPWRRPRTGGVVAATFVALPVLGGLDAWTGRPDVDHYATIFLLLVPHALYRWGSGAQIAWGTTLIVAWAGFGLARAGASLAETAGTFGLLLAPMAVGFAGRLSARAQRLALERTTDEERARLARELHDTVAHHVAAIAIRAQAGRALAELRPEAVQEALAVVEDEAQRGLREIRSLVDTPEDVGAEDEDSLAQLRALAAEGPPAVRVHLPRPPDALPRALRTTLFRMAREAVANALVHAEAVETITVAVECEAEATRLRVDNDGARLAATPTPGYGLTGMAERAALLGGRCTWGPRPEGGFRLQAFWPKEERRS